MPKVNLQRIIERINKVLREFEAKVVECKHKVGAILLEELAGVEHGEKLEVLMAVEAETGWKHAELYRCMKFAELYPDLNEFLAAHEGITWSQIAQDHLYGVIQEEPKPRAWTCDLCGQNFLTDTAEPIRIRLCTEDYEKFKTYLTRAHGD